MTRGPDLAKQELWRRRLGKFDRGSATVAEFCRRVGVSDATFYPWRRKLALPSGATRTSDNAAAKLPALSFLPIQITGREDPTARIEVVFPNGARMFVPGRDQATLHAVVTALASGSAETGSC